MVSHLFYYQLAVLVLAWLFVLLHVTVATPGLPAPPISAQPKRKRSPAPKPFAGLTHRAPCALCERETVHPNPSTPVPPAPMPPTHRRPRTVDTSRHFCPHTDCDYRGWRGLNNLRANGHPSGGPWRQFHCTACDGYFPEHHGTLFHGKQAAVERIVHVLACLAEGLGIRATARVFEVDPNTVLHWLVEAAEQLRAFTQYFLCEVHVRQVQLDELYAVLRAVKDGNLSEAEALERLERSSYWVWTALDPESKLLLVIEVGSRTLAMTQRVVHQLVQRLAPDCMPLFLTDGFKEYATALLTHYGHWRQPERRREKGPRPKPRWMPLPALLYAQVVKSYRRRRLVGMKPRVVFGTLERIEQVLAACGHKINTVCQGEDDLQYQLVLFQVYHNFVLPHASLRQSLAEPIPTHGSGSAKVWRPCTPAMAAGLTDHVWTLKEVLMFRVPPWPQPHAV